MSRTCRPLVLFLLLLAVLAFQASAAAFPDVTAEERALTSVPGQPNAPAVVLFKKGEFAMAGTVGSGPSSVFSVQVRRKILTEEGKRYGEVSIYHSRWARLQNLKGRTVLPDGRVVPLPADATFRRKASAAEKLFVTALAFPAVEVGAILDYQYELRFDTILFPEPWYFQEEVPTLYSEMVYEVAQDVVFSTWRRDPLQTGIQQETTKTAKAMRVRAWGKNLPAVPEEPHGLPFADLASRILLVPTAIQTPYETAVLFKDWPSTCDLFAEGYERARKKGKVAERKAREIAAQAGGGPREQAQAVYRFVRDEIDTEPELGLWLDRDSTADSVLAAKRGNFAEKAALLQTLLGALKIDARLVWVADREGGMVDLRLANPWWFERPIVAAQIDGQRVFLDPADRTLSFGRLAPGLEGTEALIFDRKKPETVTLPVTPFEENTRLAKLQLDLDAEGRLAGRGTLYLTGHHAWSRIDGQGDAEKTAKFWKDWLTEASGDFEITDLKVTESIDDQRVEVTWAMTQREEEVLGDEVSLMPSRPLGPLQQPFQLSATRRVSPILLAYADRDEVELTLRWPEGWKPEALPTPLRQEGAAGTAVASVELDEAARTLTYRRRFDLKEKLLVSAQLYQTIQGLYTLLEKHDAQPVVLVRR